MIIVISEITVLQRRNSLKKKKKENAYNLWRKYWRFNNRIVLKKILFWKTKVNHLYFFLPFFPVWAGLLRFGPKINLFGRWTYVPFAKVLIMVLWVVHLIMSSILKGGWKWVLGEADVSRKYPFCRHPSHAFSESLLDLLSV